MTDADVRLLRSHTNVVRRRAASAGKDSAGSASAHPLVNLQRQIGNAQVSRMLAQRQEEDELAAKRDPGLQRQEEDELAAMRDPALQRQEEDELAAKRDPALQRQEEDELAAKRDPALQRDANGTAPEVGMAGGEISESLTNRIQAQRGGGSSLDAGRQAHMESAFGTNFQDVRVHTGAESHELNQGVGAKAFTVGSDIFFSNNASPTDDRLLGHELTHVVQQRSGGVGGPQASRSLNVTAANDATEAEADRMADAVISAPATTTAARETDK